MLKIIIHHSRVTSVPTYQEFMEAK